MIRKLIYSIVFVFAVTNLNAQVQSPAQFLGYSLGTRYTPHWKVVDYFKYVANAVSANVKFEKYGETNEGRPLVVNFVSSAENMKNLEQIRLNNLRLAHLSNDKAAAVEENAPAIVWLSYNVHGNETSSSEAAMQTLFALVDPSNQQTKAWLKNTVVVLDPCINPDGRDRYVNWFNSVVGKNANPSLISMEHMEPWPGGRTNHYNFDLNRDWAWQTQIESRQRMQLYSKWMPQVHVDYHEQGVNEPYYFAPAAQPLHDVITNFQKDFQLTIGKNHAKYFDQNGWLYFTREVFDLYYPSYGDTWPMYNGAIGMTYEQGGGPAGGLAAKTNEGDTLSLLDRIQHHYTTSLSTIEIASLNAGKLISEFKKYFNDAITSGVGEYKSYIIKNKKGDQEKINALIKLLQNNNINFGYASGTTKGYSYSGYKEENVQLQKDIVIPSLQPKSALVKVLFEPKPKLADSLTYDITAWSVPYAYGLTAWASKDKISMESTTDAVFTPNNLSSAYAYVLRWQGMQSAKTVAQLLKNNVRLRFAETPFEVNGQQFERGSVIILRKQNDSPGFLTLINSIANNNNVRLEPVTTGFVDKGNDFGSDKVHAMKAPRVVLLTGDGISYAEAGEVWYFFEQELDYPLTLVNANDFMRVNWNDIDVVIMPGGRYSFLSDKTGMDAFREWIGKGGRVIAIDNAIDALSKGEFGIKSKKMEDDNAKDEKNNDEALKKYEDRERDFIPGTIAGSIYKVDLDNTHPLAYGYPSYYYTLKLDDNIYEFMKDGWNVGVIRKEQPVAGFVGNKLRKKLQDGVLFGVQQSGQGTITYLADDVLFRNFWENGKLMFCNAVFFVGQ